MIDLGLLWSGYCFHHSIDVEFNRFGRRRINVLYRGVFCYYCRDFGYLLGDLCLFFGRKYSSLLYNIRVIEDGLLGYVCVDVKEIYNLSRIYFMGFFDFVSVLDSVLISPYVYPLLCSSRSLDLYRRRFN